MLKKFFALLVVLIVSVISLCVSVSAVDDTEIYLPYTTSDGFVFDDLYNAIYGVPSPSQVREMAGNYKYISYMVVRHSNGSGGISTYVYAMCVNDISNKTVNFRCYKNDNHTSVGIGCKSSDNTSFSNHRFTASFDNTELKNYWGSADTQNSPSIGGFKDNVQSNVYIYSEIPFTINDIYISGSKPFEPQLSGKFEFMNGDLRLNVRALTSADFDNRVYLEIYDAFPAIEQLIYKPVKYVYPTYDGHSMHVSGHKIDDYLRPRETGLTYSITADTLHRAGCVSDNPYNARAYCFNDNGEPYEICYLQFAFAGDDFYTYLDTDGDGKPDVQKIAEKGEDGKYTDNYYDVATGEKLDPADLSYNFGYGVTEPTANVYDGTPDYDFDVDLSKDITQGAGLVRTIFDKIIAKSGLSGFLITVLAISIASWFIFGRRA